MTGLFILQRLPLFATLIKLLKMDCLQVENGFILPLEKEIFIDQLKDIVDKAEDMLNEDMDSEKNTALSCSPLQDQTSEVGEVRKCSISVLIYYKCKGQSLHVNVSHRVSSQEHLSLCISKMVT